MPTIRDIESAASLLHGRILQTPLVYSPYLSRLFQSHIFLKLENLQNTGSFKIRGAAYKLLSLKGDNRRIRHIITASAGNHAQGVALAAHQVRKKATVIMPEWASISKQEAIRAYGGKVVIHGKNIGESLAEAQRRARAGSLFIHPFDDAQVITGQGTIGLEILQDLPNPDRIIVPVGGGGLISGIGLAVKSVRPETRIVGIQAAACPSAVESRRLGRRVRVDPGPSLADGILVREPGKLNFRLMKQYVDDVAAVSEESIASAVLMMMEKKKVLAEGAGAVPLAALMEGIIKPGRGEKVVLVISGGNMDSPVIGRIINQGLIRNARVMQIAVTLEDIPGSLAMLLGHIASLKANVLHIRHERYIGHLPIHLSRVGLELETRGPDHVEEILKSLNAAGYDTQGIDQTALT